MPRPPKQLYIIIDDDPISIFLSRSVLQNAFAKATIIDFKSAARGLEFIKEVSPEPGTNGLLIFLDLNMPHLDGMGFLKKFAEFDEEIKCRVKIVILSSSISERDIRQVSANEYVSLFISKPLTGEAIRKVLKQCHAE